MASLLQRHGWLRHALVFLAYFALAILFTWPLAPRLTTHLAGAQSDNQLFTWTFWILRQQLLDGLDPFFTNAIYYPDGISLAFHNMVLTKSLPALLLQPVMSVDAAYNLLLIFSLALNGYAMWLLVRYLTADSIAALISGIIFGFSPILLAHAAAGHINWTGVEGLPLFAYFLLKALDQGRWQDALYAGLAAAYTVWTDWSLGLYAILFAGLLFVYRLVSERRAHLYWPVFRQYLLVGAVALFATLPVLLPTLSVSASGDYDMTRYIGGAALYVSDLFGFFTPSPNHFLLGDLVQPIFGRFTAGTAEGTVFVGFSVLFLAALGVWKIAWKKTGFWIIALILFAVISLGPGLHLLGAYRFPWLAWLPMGSIAQDLGVPMRPEWVQMFDEAPMIPLPGALFQLLPVFKWTRVYSRYFVLGMMAVAVLSGYGLAWLRANRRVQQAWGGTGAVWLSVFVAGIILFEFCILPFPTTVIPVPASLTEVTSEPGDYALLDLPIRPFQLEPQYWQTHHGRPILYAHISRVPEERFAYLDFVEREVYNSTGFFEQEEIRYLVLHKEKLVEMPSEEAQKLLVALDSQYRLAAEDATLRIYHAYD
ncbi:MAG: YfhO family protein [Caldilineaceae bacterium]|nr:YfhO family protein [Caldilineaceae bacterium]